MSKMPGIFYDQDTCDKVSNQAFIEGTLMYSWKSPYMFAFI